MASDVIAAPDLAIQLELKALDGHFALAVVAVDADLDLLAGPVLVFVEPDVHDALA